jgi:hypothetical protein
MVRLLMVLFVCFPALSHGEEFAGFYKRFEGKIGKNSVVTADLFFTDSIVSGHYYYQSVGKEILISGTLKGGRLKLKEYSDTVITGYFDGSISDDFSLAKGTWSNPARSKSLAFEFHSFLPAGSVALNSLQKQFAYEWMKNTAGESIGCVAEYTYCYLVDYQDKSVEKRINESLLSTQLMGNETPEQLKTRAANAMRDEFDNYIDSYQETFPDTVTAESKLLMDESPYSFNWDYQEKYKVIYNEHHLLCVEEFGYFYSGGAHGNYGFSYRVYHLITGEQLQLQDLFSANKMDELTAIAEMQLRADRGIPDAAALSSGGLFIDKLELKEDFFVNRGGIGFTYNPYEIASYADGPVTIYLKWEQVKSLIKPVGPVSWVLIR